MAVGIHIARVGVFNINSLTGMVVKKDDPNVTVREQLMTTTDHRIIEDAAIPNTTGSPTVTAYLTLEAAANYVLGHMDQNTIVTYNATDLNGA